MDDLEFREVGQEKMGETEKALGLGVVVVIWGWEEPFQGAKVGGKGEKEVKAVDKGEAMVATR